ncbi:MAG: hypothetical protein AAGI48_09220 [Verrucomicrobiota bacterium]
MLRRFLPLVLLPWLTLEANAGELDEPRNWTGINGKIIRATYGGTIEDGTKVILTDGRGRRLEVSIANLVEADRKLIASREGPLPGDTAPASDFKTIPPLDRDNLPVISQGDFGSKASDCVPSSFCNFLLWWDQEGILEIPRRGDFDKKAEWIHTKMARNCGTGNNRGTSTREATEGFRKYFEKEIPESATLNIRSDFDLRPENLARYTTGEVATMLEMTIRTGARHDSGHWVALVEASSNGKLVFHTWGARFEGFMKVIEENSETIVRDGQKVPRTVYEIHVANREELPEWFQNSDRRFILDPVNWDSIYVLKPYVFSVPGRRVPAPKDPFLERDEAEDDLGKPAGEALEDPPSDKGTVPSIAYPPPSNGSLPYRSWNPEGSRPLKARVTELKDDQVSLMKSDRSIVSLPLAGLKPRERGQALVDAAAVNGPMPSERIRLSYRLTIDRKQHTDLRLDIEGTTARLELVKLRQSLILDIADGAFVTRVPMPSDGELVDRAIGRFKPLERKPGEVLELLRTNYIDGPLKHREHFSGRQIRTKKNASNSEEMTLSLASIELPALPSALACLMLTEISDYDSKPTLNFSMTSRSNDLRLNLTRLPAPLIFCAETKLLPIHAEWRGQIVTRRGHFSHELNLLAAEIPNSFPDGHFSIPAEARNLEAGIMRTQR